ncbi:hypothetical protein F5Y16DRAFT_398688 [Xylariaceae sp. FL0255]|nr:hypothetical protein F5Y16DRAFT_398688 [Xylariaceae sp. FL0255]
MQSIRKIPDFSVLATITLFLTCPVTSVLPCSKGFDSVNQDNIYNVTTGSAQIANVTDVCGRLWQYQISIPSMSNRGPGKSLIAEQHEAYKKEQASRPPPPPPSPPRSPQKISYPKIEITPGPGGYIGWWADRYGQPPPPPDNQK